MCCVVSNKDYLEHETRPDWKYVDQSLGRAERPVLNKYDKVT